MEKIIGYGVSDVGRVRENNEDNFLLGHCINGNSEKHHDLHMNEDIGKWNCMAVFDGMGGLEGGEIASHLSAEIFQNKFIDEIIANKEEIDGMVEDLFSEANSVIESERTKQYVGGTTSSVLITNGIAFKVFHVGDSRIYLKRNNKLYLLSKDHTLGQLKLDAGIYLSKKDIPEKENHQLVEYIGMETYGEINKPYESEWFFWQQDDEVLLCSDGLYDMCSNDSILNELMHGDNIGKKVDNLVQNALENGGKDNITVVLVKVI